jgi:hypothetical protein
MEPKNSGITDCTRIVRVRTLVLGGALLAMLAGGITGGAIGEHFHWDIDRDAGA